MLVVAAGELDMSTAPELNEQLDAALQAVVAPASLILDLRSVTFLGSIGLALLIEYTQRGAEQATPLRVVADHRPVLRGIEATGLTEALNIYPDLDQACRASDG
jgi:anti-sigma B factor antagonist